jgi:hypothetical protein
VGDDKARPARPRPDSLTSTYAQPI